jgi:hypothetical protein
MPTQLFFIQIRLLLLGVISTLWLGCGSTKNIPLNTELQRMLEEKSFEIRSDWASPTNTVFAVSNTNLFPPVGSNPNNIDIRGNSTFFKVHGDSISADLSFFGQVQLAGSRYLPRNNNIVFHTIPENYKMTYDEKKNRFKIDFRIKHRQEAYRVIILIYNNFKTNMSINSSHRSTVHYRGEVLRDTE